MPDGFLHCTHEGMAKIEMKPMTSKEIIEQGIREGWIRPRLRDGAPFQNPPIDIGLDRPAEVLIREDRDAEDED